MRNVSVENITDVFSGYFNTDSNARFKELMCALTHNLHDFARETQLTHDEWRTGLEALEWAARICNPERNEFVLLSDVFGMSSIVDMIHSDPEATSPSVTGPLHVSDAPTMAIQDPDQDTFSFHGLMKTVKSGYYTFTTVRPVSFTVPSDDPAGQIQDVAGRHP